MPQAENHKGLLLWELVHKQFQHLQKDGVGAVCSRKTDRVFIATATGLQGVVSLQQSGRGIQKVEERNWPFCFVTM